MEAKKLLVSSSPHMRSERTVTKEMLDVIIALIPTGLAGVYFFGMKALVLMIASVASCVIAEFISNKVMKRQSSINDLSAIVTGLLLAYNIPVTMPVWQTVIGAVFAIVICKQFFGGIGQNIVNPALGARAGGEKPALLDMFIGNMGGCIGEVSTLAILIGAAYLIIRKVISIRIPAVYILTTAILLMVFNKSVDGIIEQLLSGGLMLGAFFMATDYTTSPVTKKGEIIFAFGCGLITSLIRVFGGYPEGVSYSILLMNLLVPLIDSKTMPKVFGVASKGAKDE